MELRNAGIYVRVSTERQVLEGYSISAQKENLTHFAKSHSFNIYDIYADEGISGKNIKDRPNVKRLIQDIKDGIIDIVLLQRLDRLTRSISDTQEFIDLFKKYDVDVWSINDGGIIDVKSSNGRFMTLLKGLFGQHERELTAERIKTAFSKKARDGYTLCCGCAPYGYRREKGNKIILIKQDEAKIVRRIFRMYLEGMSLSNIAKSLNYEDVSTKRSGQKINVKRCGKIIDTKAFLGIWSSKSVKLILSNPVYIGKVRYAIGRDDYYIGNGYHKPIISNEIWNRVQYRISKIKSKIHTNYPKEEVYFCGTLICGICGKKLTTSRTMGRLKKDGSRKIFYSYRCTNREKHLCDAKYISHIKIEKAFIEYLENSIAEFDSIENIVINENFIESDEINAIKKLLTVKKEKKKEIMNLFILEKINYDQFKYMDEKLEKIIQENLIRLSSLEESYKHQSIISNNNISPFIVDHWKILTNKEKLKFLNEFVKYITVVNNDICNGKVQILGVDLYSAND